MKSNLSFIDETKNTKAKVKVVKRNKEFNIRSTRLRKTLQNDKLLENYFEWNKTAPSTSDLTVYKLITPPSSGHVIGNETNPLETSSSSVHVTNGYTTNRKPISKKNRVVTSKKVQVKAATHKQNTLGMNNSQVGHVNNSSSPDLSQFSNISTESPCILSNNHCDFLTCFDYFQQAIGKYYESLTEQKNVSNNTLYACSSVGNGLNTALVSSATTQTVASINNIQLLPKLTREQNACCLVGYQQDWENNSLSSDKVQNDYYHSDDDNFFL